MNPTKSSALLLVFLFACGLTACDAVTDAHDIGVENNCGDGTTYIVRVGDSVRYPVDPGEVQIFTHVEEGEQTLHAMANTTAGTTITRQIDVTGEGDRFGICDG